MSVPGPSGSTSAPKPVLPPTLPTNPHSTKNIGSQIQRIIEGVKNNTEEEKSYLKAAAAIVLIVGLIFAFLSIILGISSAAMLVLSLVAPAFTAVMLYLGHYGGSKHKRAQQPQIDQQAIEKEKQEAKAIKEATKASKIANAIKRQALVS